MMTNHATEIEQLKLAYQRAARAYCAALEEENRRRPKPKRGTVEVFLEIQEYQMIEELREPKPCK